MGRGFTKQQQMTPGQTREYCRQINAFRDKHGTNPDVNEREKIYKKAMAEAK